MVGRGQRVGFGSFEIAIILRLWSTALTVENGVCMVNKAIILFSKRFRSKVPSAASLSPGQFADHGGTGCDFLPASHFDTVSRGKGKVRGLDFKEVSHGWEKRGNW
jgi:hypothetical protein